MQTRWVWVWQSQPSSGLLAGTAETQGATADRGWGLFTEEEMGFMSPLLPGGVQMTVMMSLSPPSLSGKLREQPAVL